MRGTGRFSGCVQVDLPARVEARISPANHRTKRKLIVSQFNLEAHADRLDGFNSKTEPKESDRQKQLTYLRASHVLFIPMIWHLQSRIAKFRHQDLFHATDGTRFSGATVPGTQERIGS